MYISPNQESVIKSYFLNKPVVNAFLFGSYAIGNANTESDVDLLLELDYSYPIGFELMDYKYELEKLLSCKVDIVTTRSLSQFIRPIVDSQKKLIYAR
ncbi:MAG: nucleotidyltransferase domain-containing protein [Bacteroidota bacterium]|nr:nucleotidyltransferase domain-containing protein [Bacteroidota bacterium]